MPHFRKRSIVLLSFPVLALLGGCDGGPECDTPETRLAVIESVSTNQADPLAGFAEKNATIPRATDASPAAKKTIERPTYQLGEKIVTASVSKDKRTLQCSSSISAAVGETKASKEIDFAVTIAPDGQRSVAVTPFQFGS
jgi:hypothetical protein